MLQIRRLYNVMALMLRKVIDGTSERDFERLRNIDEKCEYAVLEELKKKFPDLFEKDTLNAAEALEGRLKNSSVVSDVEKYVSHSQNIEEMIFLLRSLDAFLEDSIYSLMPLDQEVYYYLKNFYFVLEKQIEGYHLKQALLSKSVFRGARKRGVLRVAVSSVTDACIVKTTEPYVRDGRRFVSVKPMEEEAEQELVNRLLEVLKKAAYQETDILIFPEMLGTEWIWEMIERELEERMDLPDNEYPRLTVEPSAWRDGRNSCPIVNDMGERIFEQQKHHGVYFKEQKVMEDISSDRTIHVLHCDGIGRIGIAICKDFLLSTYLKILAEALRISLLLVPSFTFGNYQFQIMAPKYGDLDMNVIWINTCSARWLGDGGDMQEMISLAYLPGRKGIRKIEKEREDLCGGQGCSNEQCLYTYQIDLNGG